MTIAFTENAWRDYLYRNDNDANTFEKLNSLIKEIQRDPFEGTGKPEPLKRNLAGYWSRRITNEHRLVYRIHGSKPQQVLTIIQVRFHY